MLEHEKLDYGVAAMQYTEHAGLAQMINRAKRKYATPNPNNQAFSKCEDLLLFRFFHSIYVRNPVAA